MATKNPPTGAKKPRTGPRTERVPRGVYTVRIPRGAWLQHADTPAEGAPFQSLKATTVTAVGEQGGWWLFTHPVAGAEGGYIPLRVLRTEASWARRLIPASHPHFSASLETGAGAEQPAGPEVKA